MFVQTWLLPFALIVVAIAIAIPLSQYIAWVMDGKYRPLPVFSWFEKRLDSAPQNWKQYLVSLLVFNAVLFAFGFLVLSLQAWMPLNPDHKTILSPSTILHSVISFSTNTDLQHYSGDQHLSNFSQIFFGIRQSLPLGRHRALLADGHHPGLPQRPERRQLLPRHVARRRLHVPSHRLRLRRHLHLAGQPDDAAERPPGHHPRAGLDGPDGQGRRDPAKHHRRARRSLRVDEDARHERRRLLRHELRAPLREPDRHLQLLQHPRDDDIPVRPRPHVRADAQAHEARRRHLLGHADPDGRESSSGRSASTRSSPTPA